MEELKSELIKWLDSQPIDSNNIGNIRRRCFMPWDSKWNSLVRDETAVRERSLTEDTDMATINTQGEKVAEGCKATTSEVKQA